MPDICRDDPRRVSKDLKLDKYENFDVISSSYKDPFVHGRWKSKRLDVFDHNCCSNH